MIRTILCLLLVFVGAALPVSAQPGFRFAGRQRTVEIPFEYTNNFIIIEVQFGGLIPLQFIFDTGAEHTILSKREIGDVFRLHYEREFRVTGSDMQTELVAYLARNIRFDISNKLSAPGEDILVLQEDYFRFEEYAGVKVHGILSATSFSNYIFKINYQRQVITLYERAAFNRNAASDYTAVPMEMYRNKPYLNTLLHMRADSAAPVKLLVDTGAGLPLLLFSNTHPLLHPPPGALVSNIGMGLGGYLQGFAGRVFGLDLARYSQAGIITYFQDIDTTGRRATLNDRNGLVGNALLKRFIVVFDYQGAVLWLKPSRAYRQAFVYDRSGLSFVASGPRLNHFTVQAVLPASPAAEAGLQVGDELLRVGAAPATVLSLDKLQRIFQRKPGKKIRVTVRRGEEKLKKTVVLRELI